MGELIDKSDLIGALSEPTVITIYDDDRDGVADETQIEFNIGRAEAQVWSWLVGHYALGTEATTDKLLKACALDYLVAYSFERHPEYVRSYGEASRSDRWKRAEDTLARIKAGIQRPVSVEVVQRSKTVGGVIYDKGTRMFIDGPDGAKNSGDF